MSDIQEIKDLLEGVEIDIPNQIQTGVEKNIKSQNIRSIHQRTVEASLEMLELFEKFSNAPNTLHGDVDPNIQPPDEDYSPGYFYLQWEFTEVSRIPIAFYVYTGVPNLGWLQLIKPVQPKRIYGTSSDPNYVSINNTSDRIIGDFYIESSNGNEDGDIISVWIYTGVNVGNLWLKLDNSNANSILFTIQHISNAQKIQALKNLGINATLIDDKIHFFTKHPDNTGVGLELNDLAHNVIKGRELISIAQYTSGTGSSSDDWTAIGNSIEL